MDTSELVVRAQHGDEGAFAGLCVVVGNSLHAIAHRILRDADLADDAAQQALLSIWQDLPQLRDPARFEGWAYRVLVRACYTEAKKSRRSAPNLRVLHLDETSDGGGLASIADKDQLERAFQRLSVDHRAVVVLRTDNSPVGSRAAVLVREGAPQELILWFEDPPPADDCAGFVNALLDDAIVNAGFGPATEGEILLP